MCDLLIARAADNGKQAKELADLTKKK